MYKLTAYLKSGLTWVTNAPSVGELQRIASNLGADSYTITLHGSTVFSVRGQL